MVRFFFLRNDLQVAIWRDSARNRLVVAFRGTEQVGGQFQFLLKIYLYT